MASNSDMRRLVTSEIISLKRQDGNMKERGIMAEKALSRVNCLVCMDTRKLWAWRRDVFSTSIFSTHRYDIIHCNVCSTGRDIRTTDRTHGYEKNNLSDINGRINDLVKIYKDVIRPEEQEKELERIEQQAREERERREKEEEERRNRLEKENILRKQHEEYERSDSSIWGPARFSNKYVNVSNTVLDVDVQKLATLVFDAIKVYGGDFLAIANIAKNLTVSLSNNITQQEETEEVIGETEPDMFGNPKYVVIKLSKVEEETNTSCFNMCKRRNQRFTVCASYLVMSPKNSKARMECNNFISGEMTKFMDKISNTHI